MVRMGTDERAGERGRKASKSRVGPVAEIRADLRGALDDVRTAVRDVREATSGLGTLIGDVVRQVTDVDTIKALADPTRLAILRALMDDHGDGPRVMSAKELAEELGEPQTKLYRHLKVLVDADLIKVAETRLVSGIVETRYRAAQTDFHFDTDAMDGPADEEFLGVLAVAMDEYRDQFLENARRGGFPFQAGSVPKGRRIGGVGTAGARISPERARDFHARLGALLAEIETAPRDPDGVPIEALLVWYSPVGRPGRPGKKDSGAGSGAGPGGGGAVG
jgi:DNA-binding transcriptional ArsR family regulator